MVSKCTATAGAWPARVREVRRSMAKDQDKSGNDGTESDGLDDTIRIMR